MTDPMDRVDVEAVMGRMDRQAVAIRRLRKDRDALRAGLTEANETLADMMERIRMLEVMIGGKVLQEVSDESDTGRADEADEVSGNSQAIGRAASEDPWQAGDIRPVLALVDTGTWVERTECLICGKVLGRKRVMTCRSCSTARQSVIKGGLKRPIIRQCLNCGAYRKGNGGLQYVCKPCREASKQAGIR